MAPGGQALGLGPSGQSTPGGQAVGLGAGQMPNGGQATSGGTGGPCGLGVPQPAIGQGLQINNSGQGRLVGGGVSGFGQFGPIQGGLFCGVASVVGVGLGLGVGLGGVGPVSSGTKLTVAVSLFPAASNLKCTLPIPLTSPLGPWQMPSQVNVLPAVPKSSA